MAEFVAGYHSPDRSVELHHLDGVKWHDAPIPRRWHRCWVQTYGYTGWFNLVERCACGAIRVAAPVLGQSRWRDKNSRKRKESR